MEKYTFTVKEGRGELGHTFPVLYANEFPWALCQVVSLPNETRDEILSELVKRMEYFVYAEGRTDFVIVQASGTTDGRKVEITQDNAQFVDRCICECVQAAADFWAENGERIMKENGWEWV